MAKQHSGLLLLALGVILLGAPVAFPAGADPVVTIDSGRLDGRSHQGVEEFLGVPFAKAPMGERRWAPPQRIGQWNGTREATAYGASCPQQSTPGGFGPWTSEYVIAGKTDEDCLFLNVWTPAVRRGAKLPVLLWLHGGGYTSGSGSVAVYEGTQLARQGIVVVTSNYRLGALGFLAAPVLGRHPGNYGILDMIATLQWIQRNIAAFGGDPGQVTIAGQSAGAAAVHSLLASPRAKGLFVRAIAESGSGVFPVGQSLAQAEKAGAAYLQAKGAKTLAGARALPASAFLQSGGRPPSGQSPATPPPSFAPVFDEVTVSSDPSAGSTVPVLTGLVADEASALNPRYGRATVAQLSEMLRTTFGPDAQQAMSLYPAADDAAAGAAAMRVKRDLAQYGGLHWAIERHQSTSAPVYMYLFRHIEPGPNSAQYRAFHSSEIPYVFGTLDKGGRPFVEADRQLSRTLMRYWTNFITTGNPNGVDLPSWPVFDVANPRVLDIGDPIQAAPLLDAAKRAFFARELAAGLQISLL